MDPLRLVGVVAELAAALALVLVGLRVLRGRSRPHAGWDLLWGGPPDDRAGTALLVTGLGVACWAGSQAVDGAVEWQFTGLGVVLAGAFLLVLAAPSP